MHLFPESTAQSTKNASITLKAKQWIQSCSTLILNPGIITILYVKNYKPKLSFFSQRIALLNPVLDSKLHTKGDGLTRYKMYFRSFSHKYLNYIECRKSNVLGNTSFEHVTTSRMFLEFSKNKTLRIKPLCIRDHLKHVFLSKVSGVTSTIHYITVHWQGKKGIDVSHRNETK